MQDIAYNPIKRDLTMIKGDTLSFGFQIQGLGETAPTSIDFTCKNTPEDSEALFALSLNDGIVLRSYDAEEDVYTYGVRIPPSMTEDLDTGRYFYDLQLTANDDILTLMIGRLTLEHQITT